MRDTVASRDFGVVEAARHLAAARQPGLAPQGADPRRAGRGLGALRALARQPAAAAHLHRHARGVLRRRSCSGAGPQNGLSTRWCCCSRATPSGLVAARSLFTALAVIVQLRRDLLETLTAMFNPLPAIALLPLALLWFGLGAARAWSSCWSTRCSGRSRSTRMRASARCPTPCAWSAATTASSGLRYVCQILIPAAFPAILTGLKIGWAFAWRTLIAAELVFGVSSGKGGLGWFIFENKNMLDIRPVFAGLAHRDPDRPVRREPDLPHHRDRAPSAAGACSPSVIPAERQRKREVQPIANA